MPSGPEPTRQAIDTDSAQAGGLANYRATAQRVAAQAAVGSATVLVRMLVTKALFGLSANEYALYNLHDKRFADLRDYRTKKQTTARFAGINDAAHRPLVEDKLQFHRRCLEMRLPVPQLHAVISSRSVNGISDFPVLADFRAMLGWFRDREEMRVIVKPRSDALGTGVRFVTVRRGTPFDIDDRPIDIAVFGQALLQDMQRDDYLVQSFVRPHPTIAALGSGKALGTLRILTYRRNDDYWMLYALARIPSEGNVHDNFGAGANGNLIASIDVATGTIGRGWGRRSKTLAGLLDAYERNPDTGAPIKDVVVPSWREVCDAVERASRAFAVLPLLGWDVALSPEGIVFIEANSNPDIIGAQICLGQGARATLRAAWGCGR